MRQKSVLHSVIVILGAALACSASAPTAGSVVTFKDMNSGLCIDTGGSSGFTILVQAICSGASSQNFTLKASPATGYTYLVTASNLCWDVAGGSSSRGARIQQYTCVATWPEYYQLSPVSGGNYKILSGNMTNGCIDVVGASTRPGAQIEQNKCNGSANQTFQVSVVVSVSISPTTASVPSGGTQQFTATVTGTSNTAVTWSATDGSISTSGLFTAPTVTASEKVTVTATSQADPTKSASANVTVTVPGTIDVTSYGATGNGTTDDTQAIKNAIATLTSGDTLLFPCGTYRTTSPLIIKTSNVTVDGSGCATVHNTSSGRGGIMVIGGSGNGNPNYGPVVALSTTANELDTSFTTVSNLGVNPGDYVYLWQGGKDSSNGSGDTGCDPSGCRGEVVKVASVSGDTITCTTGVHDTYNPSVNAATAQKLLSPLTGMTVKNITFDGNGSNVYGLMIAGVAESAVSGVTSKNVQGAALLNRGHFNVTWSNITVTRAGSAQCGDAVWFEDQGNLSVNGMSVSNENPGTGSGCLANGAFGFGLVASANGTLSNITVDAAGAYGRPFKTTASRWNTFNSLTVKNGVQAYNGISLEYYSSHNTFNSCVVTNNGAGTGTATGNAGINSFGNFNQYNTFNQCTVTGNGNVQLLINNYDALRLGQDIGVTINGGTYTGTNTVEPVIYIIGSNANVTSARINGPGAQGLYLASTKACVNNNIFGGGTGLRAGILSNSSTNIGSGNIMNGNNSNLTPGTCSGN